jgi:hypothetical protein
MIVEKMAGAQRSASESPALHPIGNDVATTPVLEMREL